jgi:dihydroorotase
MKKLILSLILLVIITAAGILSIRYFKSSSDYVVKDIDKTAALVRQNNWKDAQTQISNIDKEWKSTEKTWSLLTDHIEVDNIEMSLKKSKEFIETLNPSQALAELESLKFMVEHIYEKEQINLKNIF